MCKPLQRCSRCQKAYYCSKDCQKANWKEHKRGCGSSSTKQGTKSGLSGSQSSKANIESLFGAKTKSWLHGQCDAKVYTLLLDSYRLRVEDEYVFRGDVSDNLLYGQDNPAVGFRRFLVKAEKKIRVSPAWWTKQKRNECIAKGDKGEQWSNLHGAVEQEDIQEHYSNNMMQIATSYVG